MTDRVDQRASRELLRKVLLLVDQLRQSAAHQGLECGALKALNVMTPKVDRGQQARMQAPALPIGAAEWAATEHLIELGGEVVQGLLIVQNFDRDDESARFREFSEAYFKRFQRKPSYSSVSAHDAATVLLKAMKERQSGESLKQAALRVGPYQGLQQVIEFDANGDTARKVFFTEIRDGRFVKIRS